MASGPEEGRAPLVGLALPMAGGPPERADAARNRRRILAAARALLARSGTAGLTMDAVAREAEVGVGTVYRRFGDLAGLAWALADEGEAAFQTAFLSGPPPLGPGAPPAERIRAFLRTLVERNDEHAALLALVERLKHAGRFSAAYEVQHTHLATLLTAASPHLDASYLADVLLAPFAANLHLHQRQARGMDTARIRAGFDQFLELLDLDALGP
ncbi:TetR/AcrR family transcriptional regulator [Nitriliruptor alkaliphilus]|uniref:TetR/AcrR family transcriptional regulator n=1 Tax=Nitriliruptor alkaliphilus TaxID=427918 RepID=UPI000B12D27F|nr:TetR/AcrR family transcriptional regulator [Nitriliruptor alkaliphilus]